MRSAQPHLPILVGLVTKTSWGSDVRAILLLVLSGVAGILNEYINGPNNFNWQQAIFAAVGAFIIGVAAHFGLWKHVGVSAAAQNSLIKD